MCISALLLEKLERSTQKNAMHEFSSKSLSPSQAGATVCSLSIEDWTSKYYFGYSAWLYIQLYGVIIEGWLSPQDHIHRLLNS